LVLPPAQLDALRRDIWAGGVWNTALLSFIRSLRPRYKTGTISDIHIPIVVFLAYALRGIELAVLLKFGMAAVIGVPLCFAVAYIVRKIPRVSRIL